MIKITLDTSILGAEKIDNLKRFLRGKEFDLVATSVSDREIRGSSIRSLSKSIAETAVWDESEWGKMVWGGSIMETGVVGESELGNAVLGSDQSVSIFESILTIISDGAFPKSGKRTNLTKGERHQLRDSMILEAHTREKRNIFVSDDKRAYVGKDNSKRSKLEKLCQTKIMTLEEFISWIKSGKS